MKIKERLNQIIVGLREESVRYPRMKTTDVIYILSNVISTVYEDEKPIIPQPRQETIEEVKDLNYWKNNAEEDYLQVPISVLRYISELEKVIESEHTQHKKH